MTPEDLQKGFEANYGERVEVLAIVLGNQRVAQEVWDMARSNLNPTFFGELAAQYSIEPVSRANLGEVPPIRRFSGQPKIEEEAFSLTKEDPLSAIVAVADKYVIMYYMGRTEPVVREMDAVRDELQKDLREKKLRLAMAQQFDRLRESAQIDNFLAGTLQSGKSSPRPATLNPGPNQRPARSSPKLVRPVSAQGQRPRCVDRPVAAIASRSERGTASTDSDAAMPSAHGLARRASLRPSDVLGRPSYGGRGALESDFVGQPVAGTVPRMFAEPSVLAGSGAPRSDRLP